MIVGVFLKESKNQGLKMALKKALVANGHLCTMIPEGADIIVTDDESIHYAPNGIPVVHIVNERCSVIDSSDLPLNGTATKKAGTVLAVMSYSFSLPLNVKVKIP